MPRGTHTQPGTSAKHFGLWFHLDSPCGLRQTREVCRGVPQLTGGATGRSGAHRGWLPSIRASEARALFSSRNRVRIFRVCPERRDSFFYFFCMCQFPIMHETQALGIKAKHFSTSPFKPKSELLAFKVIKKISLRPCISPSIFCVFIPPTLYLIYSKICLLQILNLQTRKPQLP